MLGFTMTVSLLLAPWSSNAVCRTCTLRLGVPLTVRDCMRYASCTGVHLSSAYASQRLPNNQLDPSFPHI